MCLTVDADKHLIKRPAPIRPVALVYPPLPDFSGKQRAKTVPPVPYGFMADVDAGLKQDIFDLSRYEARVRELIAGNAMLEAAAEPILRARAGLRHELSGLEKMVRNLAKQDRACQLLMTMPGVGAVIALTFTSAIDDPERFRRSQDVGPWVGLTPGRDQSGERDIVGAITKAGDAGLRTALYQAATVMLNRAGPNWLKAWALRLAKLRGKKRATIALARRIGVVLHRMWRDGTEFRFTREEAMAIRTA